MLRRNRVVLPDPVRLHAYQAALEQCCPGKVVCEIGVGVGVFSLMALQLGATRVYGIDSDPDALQLAERVIRRNGFGAERFVAVSGHSTAVDLPEPVEVMVSDLLDRVVAGKDVCTIMQDAKLRFAGPDCVFVPSEIEFRAALARPLAFQAECELWDADLFCKFGMDFADVIPLLRSRKQKVKLRDEELVSDWKTLYRVEFADPSTWEIPDAALLEVRKPGRTDGVCFAYNAALMDGVHIGNLPADSATGPEQSFQPFPERLLCGEGDLLEISCRTDETGLDFASNFEVVPAPNAAEYKASRRSG